MVNRGGGSNPHVVSKNRKLSILQSDKNDRIDFVRDWTQRHSTGQGPTPQISDAYCPIVRSLENFPQLATFRIAFWANRSGSSTRNALRRSRLAQYRR